jgi:hypothetical protein
MTKRITKYNKNSYSSKNIKFSKQTNSNSNNLINRILKKYKIKMIQENLNHCLIHTNILLELESLKILAKIHILLNYKIYNQNYIQIMLICLNIIGIQIIKK